MVSSKAILIATAMISGAVNAHYANMGQDGVSCYIYNGIKGTPQGHMIVKHADNTWIDYDDESRHGSITTVHSQPEYDALETKTKVGIVCSPDDVDINTIGIPYVEMEATDEEFYGGKQTVYTPVVGLSKRIYWSCVITFCTGSGK